VVRVSSLNVTMNLDSHSTIALSLFSIYTHSIRHAHQFSGLRQIHGLC
jgi:hypothetical protein